MSVEQIIGLTLALLIMLIGVAGCILPAIPGTPLILIGAIAHRLYFGAASADLWILAILVLLTLFSIGVDYLASTLGAKKLGATWRGMTGAVVGALVGLFFSIPGILLGPFIGAFLFELIGGYEYRKALKAGLGAFLGLLAGTLGKIAISVVMITLFLINVVYRSMQSPAAWN
jgi:uncharacterized protein YqgC (DUF456 family)